MNFKVAIVSLGLALGSLHPAAAATTLRFAFQGDLKSLDPYSLNETFSLGVLATFMKD